MTAPQQAGSTALILPDELDVQPAFVRTGPMARGVGVAAGAVTFGVYLVGSGRSYDYDSSETVGSFIATPSLLDPFRRQLVYNNHPLFSFLDHLVYSAGGRSALDLRILPILFGAAVVAIVVAWCAGRWGVVAAATAGLVLGANSSFAELSRSVRGYSLLCLSAVVSTLLVDRLLTKPRPWVSAAYIVAVAAGIATHVYMLLVLLGHIGIVGARSGATRAWLTRWSAAIALGALAYVDIGAAMVRSASRADHVFRPRFPLALLTTLLGGTPTTLVLLGLLALVGAAAVFTRALLMSAAAITAGVLVIWLWLAPPELYPRFLIWLAPPAALAVAVAVRRFPLALPLVAAAAFLMVRLDAAHWSQDPLPNRQAAVLVRAIQSHDGNPCVFPLIRGSLLAYAHAPKEVTRPTQLRNCELVLTLAADPQSLRLAARRDFEHHWLLKAWTPMIVFSRLPQDELLSARG